MLDKSTIDILKVLLTFLAGIATAIWAFYKFYHHEKKQEKEKTSHLILKSAMKKLGEKESLSIVRFTLNIINESNTKIYVLADYSNIYGIKMLPRQLSEEEYINKSIKKIIEKKYAFLHRYVKLKEKKIVFSGKIFDYEDYWWLEPNEKIEVNRITYIPSSFDYAEMNTTIYYSINKDWLNVKTVPADNERGLCHEVFINTEKFNGQKFEWNNKEHLKLHEKYRNAEINNSSLLIIK